MQPASAPLKQPHNPDCSPTSCRLCHIQPRQPAVHANNTVPGSHRQHRTHLLPPKPGAHSVQVAPTKLGVLQALKHWPLISVKPAVHCSHTGAAPSLQTVEAQFDTGWQSEHWPLVSTKPALHCLHTGGVPAGSQTAVAQFGRAEQGAASEPCKFEQGRRVGKILRSEHTYQAVCGGSSSCNIVNRSR